MQDEKIYEILKTAKNIAIVGLSPDESKASNMVAKYLQKNGYKIYPIYPKESEILGEKAYRNLSEISDDIDMVVMFRKAEFAEILIDEVIKQNVKTLWLQLDIKNEVANQKAKEKNINFIQDRCVKIEHQRVFHKI